MKKKGFTLIELLAVIVVLAIIALISTPIVLNVIEKAEKGAFEDSAYGIVDATRLYYANASLDGKVAEEKFTFPDDKKLKLSGKKPESGSAILYEDGEVSLNISNNKWCAIKEKEKEKVSITGYSIGDCEIKEDTPPISDSCFIVNPDDPSEITGYTCDSTIVTIPSEINGVEIKKIGDNAFKDKGLTEVTIPDGITSIGSSAFEGNHLTKVEIPGSVETIGDNAFKNNQLTELILNEGLKSIGSGAFEGNQLTNVKIPSTVTDIGDNAFKNNQLTKVEIPDETNIGEGAFDGNDLSSTDQTKAVINNIDIKTTSTTITVTVDAEVGNFGKIKEYEYNIDKGSYTKGTNTFTFENLEFESEHEIGIKVITDSGLITEKSVSATTERGVLSVTANGYTGIYDGTAHGITVTSSGATIKYGIEEGTYNLESSPAYTDVGTYKVYYEVTRDKYKTLTGSKEVVISKAEGSVSLSETSGSLAYPNTKTITVIKNTGGGNLSCTSSNSSIATCQVSETTITITPGTTAGVADITVTSASTKNYNEATATYTATTASGMLSVTANGYTGTYDGSAHGISVSSNGATVKYGTTEGTYNLDSSPTYTNPGTYTVYYEVTRAGYKTVTGSKDVVISKTNGEVTLSETSGNLTYPNTKTITVTKNKGGGNLSCNSSNNSIATCQVSGTNVTITPGTTAGNAIITVTSGATTNYDEASASYSVTVASGILSVTANGYNGYYDGNAHGISVSSSGATIKYGTSEGTYNLDSSPTYTEIGTYTVYYQVTKTGYITVTGSKTVEIKPCYTVSTSDSSEITGYFCSKQDITIPREIDGVQIKKIGVNAFSQKNLTSVTIPEGIVEIKNGAFQLNQLTNIVIPETVTNLGYGTFYGNQLASVTIPNSITIIPMMTFENNQLTNISIPKSVTLIDSQAFKNNKLTSIIIPTNVTNIGDHAFASNQLTSITIQSIRTIITNGAFNDNKLPSSNAFFYKRNPLELTEDKSTLVSYGGAQRSNVIIPNNVTTIGANAFDENELTSVTIPGSVTSIESYAFEKNKLTSVTIPSSVTSIGFSAFRGNQSDMKVIVNKANGSISGSPWGASSVQWNG